MAMFNTKHFCDEEKARKATKPLLDAKPAKQIKETVSFTNLTESADALKESSRKFYVVCANLGAENSKKTSACWKELVEEFPGASGSFFMFSWASTEVMKKVSDDTNCWSHRDCGIWK